MERRLKEKLRIAVGSGEPLEGKVVGRRKGGFDVTISGALNLDDILEAINTDDDNTGDLVAQLAADGLGIELVDSSTGGSDLSVTALNDSLAASDLGLLKTVTGGGATLSGDRLVAGVNSVLLRSLGGGSGVEGYWAAIDAAAKLDTWRGALLDRLAKVGR